MCGFQLYSYKQIRLVYVLESNVSCDAALQYEEREAVVVSVTTH